MSAAEYTNGRDEYGDRPWRQHVELPAGDKDRAPDPAYRLTLDGHGNPLHVGAALAAWSGDVWAEAHRDCDAPWYCERCEKPVCPRCDPSPGEFNLCADCDWLGGDAA